MRQIVFSLHPVTVLILLLTVAFVAGFGGGESPTVTVTPKSTGDAGNSA